ncbi:MAG: haloacid dehalogenase [Acidimicrobiaceae bacterium]|nr:haloacid dehalogenase [Acidimicrobiaceae bacterium]
MAARTDEARHGARQPPSTTGLTDAEVAARTVTDGPNELPTPPRRTGAARFAAELVHFFALMLWIAAALAWLAGLPALTVAIAAVVVVNAAFAFVQEHRADRAADRLRVMLPTRVTVRRNGRTVEIEARDVVSGDVLLLEAGDRIPADAEVAVSDSLSVDTSLLTGESVSVPCTVHELVFAGTFVVEGAAEAVVTATGRRTRLARIAGLASSTATPRTPLTNELSRLVRTISVIAISVGVVFLGMSTLLGLDVADGLVIAIGVTVALVPEALLPTVTLSLAWGAEQMADKQVLVRRLDAVETLGSTTFVCTDKTGTLTCNEMTVVSCWTPAGVVEVRGHGYGPTAVVEGDETARRAAARLSAAGVGASTGFAAGAPDGSWVAHGEPMDAALDAFARRVGIAVEQVRAEQVLVRHPFDARRRRTSTVLRTSVAVKGAPEAVLPLCLGPTDEALAAVDAMTHRGLRVLAIATRSWDDAIDGTAVDAVECDLRLLGLVGLEDPPREGVKDAIAACRRAGVKVAMLTGDHPDTARAIAERLDLLAAGGTVVSGVDLPTDDAELGALLDRDGLVVARVEPEDKLRIARALRSRGHVVAMTGDGVNDAPALHEADIGIAMGRSGTDVAREASDLVLLDDHFSSIVAGIEQGRTTFVNIRRFLTYHLSDNVAELTPFVLWGLSGGRFPLALGVLQVLALDLGTDTLSAVALGAEPPARHVLDDPPVTGRLLDRTVARRAFGFLGPLIAGLTMVVFLASLFASGWWFGDPGPTAEVLATASGAAFMTVVLAQTANAFACRSSSRTVFELGWTTNRLLPAAALLELGFSFAVIGIPLIADELGHAMPSVTGWCGALAAPFVVIAADTADKHRRRRRHDEASGSGVRCG